MSISPTKWKAQINIVIPLITDKIDYFRSLFPNSEKTVLESMIENLNIESDYIFIIQKSCLNNKTREILNRVPCKIIQVNNLTNSVLTLLSSKEYINTPNPLMIVNWKNYLKWDVNEFMYCASSLEIDGCISTFSCDPELSFIEINSEGFITKILEKVSISRIPTTGIYYWTQGTDFVNSAEELIQKDNSQDFSIESVYNNSILKGLKFKNINF